MEITKKQAMVQVIIKSLLAGFLIGLAACIYAGCENKIVGAGLFSIGLIAVILLGAFLYTGKIGEVCSKETLKYALIGLVFNLIAAFVVGLCFRLSRGPQPIIDLRIAVLTSSYGWLKVILRGILTGALIYLAVELFKVSTNCIEIKGKLILIILPVIAFILAGGYHCIADAAYYGMSELSWQGLASIGLTIIGNSIGSLLVRGLQTNFKFK